MRIIKLDAESLGLLGDSNWLSVIALFDLAGRHGTQFMLDQPTPLAQSRASRYIRYLHGRYIGTYLRSYDGALPESAVRQVVQAEDCPRNIKSVGWQSQRDWDKICLIPDPYYFLERGYEDFLPDGTDLPPWSTRLSTVVWRGSTTGVVEGADMRANGFGLDSLSRLPRYRMCQILRDLGDGADAGIVAIVQCPDSEKAVIADRLSTEHLLRRYIAPQDMTRYKFLIDIDGNANSWNMVQRLRLGCCILKVESPWVQWLDHRIEPWTHYVPINADLGDLLEKVEWCRTHDREAERIASNGRRLGLSVRYEVEMRQAGLDILRHAIPLSGDADDVAALQRLCAAADRLGPVWEAAIDASSSFPEPMWLRTAHGTILGRDRSGAITQLAAEGDLADAIMLCDADGRWREQLGGFHIDRTGSTVRLERAGLFLCAHHDRVSTTCDRPEEGEWENFTLVPSRG